MTDKFTFGSAGEIHDLEFALVRNEWTHALLKKATRGDFFRLVREVVEGRAEICRIERLAGAGAVMSQHIIDCDAKPFEPEGLTVASELDQIPNRVRRQFIFSLTKIKLHLSPNQQGGKFIEGNKLRNELSGELALDANVLDYLLKNTAIIPEECKHKAVFFWGTIYRGPLDRLYVRFLYFRGERWYSNYRELGSLWGGGNPAAVRS